MVHHFECETIWEISRNGPRIDIFFKAMLPNGGVRKLSQFFIFSVFWLNLLCAAVVHIDVQPFSCTCVSAKKKTRGCQSLLAPGVTRALWPPVRVFFHFCVVACWTRRAHQYSAVRISGGMAVALLLFFAWVRWIFGCRCYQVALWTLFTATWAYRVGRDL